MSGVTFFSHFYRTRAYRFDRPLRHLQSGSPQLAACLPDPPVPALPASWPSSLGQLECLKLVSWFRGGQLCDIANGL